MKRINKWILQKTSCKKTKQLFLIIIILFSFLNYGCEKEDFDQYYVKYKIDSSNIDTGKTLNVAFNSEDNKDIKIIIDQNINWEIVIGPVSKGFIAKLDVWSTKAAPNLQFSAEINVSKNESPFAVKAIKTIRDNNTSSFINQIKIDYTIDY